MTPAELIQWHEREAERFDEGGRGWSADGHEAQAEAWFEDAAFHRSAAETVRRLVEGLEGLVRAVEATDEATAGLFVLAEIHGRIYDGPTHSEAMTAARRALAGAPTDEEKRA